MSSKSCRRKDPFNGPWETLFGDLFLWGIPVFQLVISQFFRGFSDPAFLWLSLPLSLLEGPIIGILALLQGSIGPFGPKVAKRVRNEFAGPLSPSIPKTPKRVKNKSESTVFHLFWLFFDSVLTFWTPTPGGPGNSFRTLWATLGPKGPNDPCSGQKFS